MVHEGVCVVSAPRARRRRACLWRPEARQGQAWGEFVSLIPGLRAVDCGRLEMPRIVEQMTPLILSINVRHKMRARIKITGLRAMFAPAEG